MVSIVARRGSQIIEKQFTSMYEALKWAFHYRVYGWRVSLRYR